MPSNRARFLASSLLSGVVVSVAFAQQVVDVPLRNWTVPPYRLTSGSVGLSPMTDISPGIGFVAATPCRIADTRGLGFTGQAGPPALDTGTRTFQIAGTVAGVTTQCGIPVGADAVSFQFTIIQPNVDGNLIAWPAGGTPPTISVLNWAGGIFALGNGTIVPISAAGALSVQINAAVGNATGHLVIDVNGYFSDIYNAGVLFRVTADDGAAIEGVNFSTVSEASGVLGVMSSLSPAGNSAGVHGRHNSTGAAGAGVTGTHLGGGIGVHGIALGTSGASSTGVFGQTASMTNGAVGVHGLASQPSGRTHGVLGTTASSALGAAGVTGRDGTGTMTGLDTCCFSAGVRGEAKNGNGVLGLSEAIGSVGVLRSAGGTNLAIGYLGAIQMAANYGVYSNGNAHVTGNLTVAGMKPFVQPHPSDPSKEIRYVALEGPHSEIYFRGTAQISQGVTRIDVPEHFRFVGAPGSYSTLVTPVGGMATVAVLSEGEDGIVVQASRNVKIHYVVYAEREAVRNPDPIVENIHFRPEPDDEMLAHVPDSYRQLMIQNGTLNSDGTVNMETARRLGWDNEWEKRARPAPQPTE